MSSDETTVEVQAIADRCKECGQAIRVLVLESWIAADGHQAASLRGEPIPHTRNECERMVRLEKETWPCLF
jgi:hypothetical protein